jgi:hypothetical protein
MEGLNELLSTFDDVGVSRGTMNGQPLAYVSAQDCGYGCKPGQVQMLQHLRNYEAKKGTRRTWKDSMQMRIRQSVVEARQNKSADTSF